MGSVVRNNSFEVVLPTYNGEAYLEQQIASIYAQTVCPRRLLVRDDGSSDNTVELLGRLQEHYGSWLEVLPTERHMGCIANINCLLEFTTSDYVALADQDDVWLPYKVELSLDKLRQMEADQGSTTPLLVHSDLKLVDANGNFMGCTYWQKQCLDPSRTNPRDLALTNVVTGCTVVMNRALLKKALPIPPEALMHDWWLALVASLVGKISYVTEPTVLYRQHGRNLLGAEGLGLHYWLRRIKVVLSEPSAGVHTRSAFNQLVILENRYCQFVSSLPELLKQPRLLRCFSLLFLPAHERPLKHGVLRTVGLYLLILCMPRS